MDTLENEFIKIEASNAGAELHSIFHKKKNQEFLWNADAAWWPRHAPVLFPIVGKLNNNRYTIDGKAFSLPQHGFARDSEFELAGNTGTKLSYRLRSDAASLLKYPFEFELTVSYTLRYQTVVVGYEVLNTGKKVQLFSIGAHPGFALAPGEKLADYYLEFEQEESLDRHLLTNGVFNGTTEPVVRNARILELNDELMEKDAIVFKDMRSQIIVLKSRVSDYRLVFASPGFPYFGIWSKPGAPFVCLEPWCGHADNLGFDGAFSLKEGVEKLDVGQTFSREFSITIA